jgi:hypothetical protein
MATTWLNTIWLQTNKPARVSSSDFLICFKCEWISTLIDNNLGRQLFCVCNYPIRFVLIIKTVEFFFTTTRVGKPVTWTFTLPKSSRYPSVHLHLVRDSLIDNPVCSVCWRGSNMTGTAIQIQTPLILVVICHSTHYFLVDCHSVDRHGDCHAKARIHDRQGPIIECCLWTTRWLFLEIMNMFRVYCLIVSWFLFSFVCIFFVILGGSWDSPHQAGVLHRRGGE